ncbi:jg10197 [Pararge aegeria aegeria]|uniref:Jg10197 protein n=1 Tax=Pararge aegeria aegeria TaxID=348720 RepID=A0A8S4R2X5_9NEOP|nr:jg10197 [Pararge aegeria aegeria]
MEQNHILEHNNKQLSVSIMRLKEKLNLEKNESKACVASAQRVSDQSDEVYQKLLDTRAKLSQLTKQKETNDKLLHNKIARLQLQNDKLLDRIRNKSGDLIKICEHKSCYCDLTMKVRKTSLQTFM